jgi:predicted NBD/HSP70 family sugar kinase
MSTNQWAIGIDLGGTKIEVALVNSSGLLHDRLRVPTDTAAFALHSMDKT